MTPCFPLSLRDIRRTFVQGDRTLEVLRGVILDLQGRARSWPWSASRAAASRPCCTSPACSSGRTAARSWSTASRPARLGDARAHGAAPAVPGLRLPVPSPAAGVLGAGERDAAADAERPVAQRGAPARRRAAGHGRPEGARRPPAGPAVGRRAAARRHRPRRRQCAARAAGRRADRQSRLVDRGYGVPPAAGAGARDRHGGPDRHPQSRARPHGPHVDQGRGADG